MASQAFSMPKLKGAPSVIDVYSGHGRGPEAGHLIPETGGLRKLRWTAKGRGRRSGSRVIHYFHNLDVPLFLMAIFAKNIQTDLTPQQRKALARQLSALKMEWKEKRAK
jgi:hypothetical protein